MKCKEKERREKRGAFAVLRQVGNSYEFEFEFWNFFKKRKKKKKRGLFSDLI